MYLCTVKLSVVIPVYRVEATLHRCVESVLNQRVADMEVILVDDGSPDRCPQLCDEWARCDPRIRTVHQPNGGLSDARNTGISMATGEVITFVDSDDYLSPDTYAPLLEKMGDLDLLEYAIADRLTPEDHVYTTAADYWLQTRAYTHTYAWNKLYRRTLFREARYPKGKVFEDVYLLPQLLRQAHKIGTTHLGCYHYCWNPEGITATADGEALTQLLEAHLSGGMPVDDRYYMYLVNIQMDVWERTGAPPILPKRKLDASSLEGKLRLKAIALNTVGINILCKITKAIHYVRKPSRS